MIWVQDAAKSKEAFALLGCVTGPHVQSGKASAAVASSSKITIKPKEPIMKRAPAPSTTTPTKEEEKSSKTKLEVEPKAKELPKTKPTGRLDWSKTKPKLKEASKPVEPEKGAKTRARVDDAKAKGDAAKSQAQADLRKVKKEPSPDTSDEKISEESDPSKSRPKRGTKRKSVLPTLSDSEEDEEPSQKDQIGKITARVKKNVILSDDDEEPDDIPARRRLTGAKAKGKAKASLSDTEADKSVRAMMDIDDDEVIKASRPESRVQEDEDAQTEDAEVVQDSEPERAKLNPKKRKEKKVVPVGRNGLKKKRVMKTRTKIDEKGYMVTEDYSSYESVDDDEPEAAVEAPVKKGRAAKPKQKATESKLKPKESREEARSTKSSEPVKRATGKGSGQGNITNFFGKAK
ncbi:hypothetical protein OBBRIDRAFT_259489 [Obba rivulosa]|uniref:DNA polymerase delta subunit 3 n=1 Tax=Obba rivulosa TaxID=1052685 RepID=A0A8E2AK98_9APHY|nr:hypothetical protein OBBRIDRAFT_259489 [Obba rivulosa]